MCQENDSVNEVEIKNAADLGNIRNKPDSKVTYKLMNDIQLTGMFEPIGTQEKPFAGVFDGNGKQISGLTIEKSTSNYVGLFGFCDGSAVIKNVSVNGKVTGQDYVGGIAGRFTSANDPSAAGGIFNCFAHITVQGRAYVGGIAGALNGTAVSACGATGSVTSTAKNINNHTGGIAGLYTADEKGSNTLNQCFHYGIVSGSTASTTKITSNIGGIIGYLLGNNNTQPVCADCYHIGFIQSDLTAGGVCGSVDKGIIMRCFAAGSIIIKAADSTAGGITGSGSGYTVSHCYSAFTMICGTRTHPIAAGNGDINGCYIWDGMLFQSNDESAYHGYADDGTDCVMLDISAMDANFYRTKLRWDCRTIWVLPKEDYPFPRLRALRPAYADYEQPTEYSLSCKTIGDGSTTRPYEIYNAVQFRAIAENLSAVYRMMADLRFCNYPVTPIGNGVMRFNGTLQGNGHHITDFCILCPDRDDVGLFGAMGVNARIENLVVSGHVEGRRNVGLLCGYCEGVIENCVADGTVVGAENVGAFAGTQQKGHIYNSHTDRHITVTGKKNVGGIVGECGGKIAYCYTLGTVNGQERTGGITGILYTFTDAGQIAHSAAILQAYACLDLHSAGRIAGVNFASCNGNYAISRLIPTAIDDPNGRDGKGKEMKDFTKKETWVNFIFQEDVFAKSGSVWRWQDNMPVLYFE